MNMTDVDSGSLGFIQAVRLQQRHSELPVLGGCRLRRVGRRRRTTESSARPDPMDAIRRRETVHRLRGIELDLARVRIGAARYMGRDNKPAFEYLSSFQSSNAEVEAERLYYLLECARRLDRTDDMNRTRHS